MSGKPLTLTVRAVISDQEDRRLVLQRTGGSRWYAGQWEFPGGKVAVGESFQEGLIREVREETGLDVALERFLGAAQQEMPQVRVIILFMQCRVEGGEIRLSDEHEAWDWVSRDEFLQLELSGEVEKFRDCLLASP